MQLFHSQRKQEELADSESRLSVYTDLRLGVGGNGEAVKPEQKPKIHSPVQLDLLPVKPVASKPQSSLHLLFQQQQQHPLRHATPTASSLDREEKLSAASYSVTGIDINQIPASGESQNPNDFSPASSTLSPLQANEERRERCKKREMDDRTCEINSRGTSDEEEGCNPRKKLRLSKEQSALLEESFKEHSTLNPKQKQALARQLGLRARQVEVWFQNRRARTKLKQTEVDCELLKRCCERLAEENRRLQKELQDLRTMKVGTSCVVTQDFFRPLPATALSMCPSCERMTSAENRPHGFSKASGFTRHVQSSAACS